MLRSPKYANMGHWPNIYRTNPNILYEKVVNIRPAPHLHLFWPAHLAIVCYAVQLSEYGALAKHLQNQPEYLQKVASKVTSAEPPGRGNGTDQLGCLTVPGRFHYPSQGAAYIHLAPRLRPYLRCVHQGMGVIKKCGYWVLGIQC